MPTHEPKQCQRCGTEFECKVGSVLQCQCQSVEMTAKQLEYVTRKYDDCLCALCLMALRSEFNIAQHKIKIMKLCFS